jgi:glycosyltransferase involved in cell wall biosynthesis
VDDVVVVDDASPDSTYDCAARARTRDPRVEVVRLGYNVGVGGAIVRGYDVARRRGADVAAVMAGDDQMDPGDLPALLAPIAGNRADYVKGNRLAHPQARRMPWVRRIGTQVLARLTARVAGLDGLDDAQCGYTALRLALIERLPLGEIYPRYGYPNDMLMRLAEIDARICEVPVRPVYADEVSGLAPHRVVLPIARILVRGWVRRANRLRHE